jgi:hypothetical protein
MSKKKLSKQTLHSFIKTKKERIAGQSIAEILNDDERYGAAQKGRRERTFQASNWNMMRRMPSRPKPIQRMKIGIVHISFDEELRRERGLRREMSGETIAA